MTMMITPAVVIASFLFINMLILIPLLLLLQPMRLLYTTDTPPARTYAHINGRRLEKKVEEGFLGGQAEEEEEEKPFSSRVMFVKFAYFEREFLKSGHLRHAVPGSLDAKSRIRISRKMGTSDTREAYLKGFLTVDKSDVNAKRIIEACDVADRDIKNAGCQRLAGLTWKLVVLDDEVENGYPHTISDVICLPQSFIKDEHPSIVTLIHEKIHVFQRAYPDETAKIVSRLGYRPFTESEARRNSCDDMRRRLRANPDLDGRLYVNRSTGCIPAAVYKHGDDKIQSLADASLVCLNVKDKTGKSVKDEPKYEHPYEEMAYRFSLVIVSFSRYSSDHHRDNEILLSSLSHM